MDRSPDEEKEADETQSLGLFRDKANSQQSYTQKSFGTKSSTSTKSTSTKMADLLRDPAYDAFIKYLASQGIELDAASADAAENFFNKYTVKIFEKVAKGKKDPSDEMTTDLEAAGLTAEVVEALVEKWKKKYTIITKNVDEQST